MIGGPMKSISWIFSGVAALTLATGLASAHHSVIGQFDPDARIELNGVISKIDFVNPHIYLHLDVEDESGETITWRLESVPPAFLYRAEVTQDMLMGDGSPVRIEAIRGRDQSQLLGFIIRIHYADGHYYQLGEDY